MEFIENPHFNVVVFGNQDELFSACRRDRDIANGFLNRFTVVEEPALIKMRTDFAVEDLLEKLLDKLKRIRDLKPQRLEWTAGAKDMYQAEVDWLFAQPDDLRGKLWSRNPEKLPPGSPRPR